MTNLLMIEAAAVLSLYGLVSMGLTADQMVEFVQQQTKATMQWVFVTH